MADEKRGGLCRDCSRRVVVFRRGTNHILHLLVTICTLGLWLIVWFGNSVKFGGGEVHGMRKQAYFRGALIVALVGLPVAACAQVYKCADAAGKMVYQQAPCLDGQYVDTRAAGAVARSAKNQAIIEEYKRKAWASGLMRLW